MNPWEFPLLVDFLLDPRWSKKPFRGFNGQRGRQQIVRDLMEEFKPQSFVETGTYLGDTAGWVAQEFKFVIPVWTSETEERYAKVAGIRCKNLPVAVCHRDSRDFLKRLASIESCNVFFYLDAHWNVDWPLSEELELIVSSRPHGEFLIMIDDFAVPDDPGYAHDSFGMTECGALFSKLELTPFFPTLKGSDEEDPRRGCVVLAPWQRVERMGKVESLRRYQ